MPRLAAVWTSVSRAERLTARRRLGRKLDRSIEEDLGWQRLLTLFHMQSASRNEDEVRLQQARTKACPQTLIFD